MVLWELALGTAYFLGLKRTYRLSLKIQRRLISAKHLKIRDFAHRRARSVFHIALTVHQKIQERDILVSRNLGNWILRLLDRAKPSAQISEAPPSSTNSNSTVYTTKQLQSFSNIKEVLKNAGNQNRHLFRRVMWSKQSMLLRSLRSTGRVTQSRDLTAASPKLPGPNNATSEWGGVIRKDMMQWILQK